MTPGELLARLTESQSRLLLAVRALPDAVMRQPSRLPGWSRDMLVAHLRFGAEAALRGVTSAAAGSEGLMYPGGDAQRDAEISTGRARPASELARELADACARLESALRGLGASDWAASVQTRRGPVAVSEVVLQRWLDVEVHLVDLDIGYATSDWPAQLVSEFLPAMIAMLPALHRRPDADRGIAGTWVFRRTDDVDEWAVTVDHDRAWTGAPTMEPAATFEADGSSLLALLLGRQSPNTVDTDGSTIHARKLKAAFPGP